ncbi:MAG: alpha/beta hydrolase fold domain-containing protein, partial [Oscillospiraceae bacterium]|nr:alpha/beta hydrolase fold domain-containing protein [Oscillospiraceae bacterium]
MFRSLDEETQVQEEFIKTDFGTTHIFVVRERETAPDKKLPVVVNVHGGGWCLDHTERDIYFSRRLAHRLHCLVIDVDYVLAP